MTISRERADALWSEFAGGLMTADAALKKIVELRAWEPLGMAFAEAYEHYVKGVRLTNRESVVQVTILLAEEMGWDADGIAKLTGGAVFPAQVEKIKQAHGVGVPAELINPGPKVPVQKVVPAPGEHVVTEHTRKSPSAHTHLHLTFTTTELAQFKSLATQSGTTVEAVAEGGVRYAFDLLAKSKSA